MMRVQEFFSLFIEELKENKGLWKYYKFLTEEKKFYFRKAYFCQRLDFIEKQIQKRNSTIWDFGCGYGTTALFLAMNGFSVFGSTLEFYFEEIEKRKQYWNQFGNANLFTCNYEDIFDSHPENDFDFIVVQDTLHHIEPIDEGLKILANCLKHGGKLVVIEENGNNLLENSRLIMQRGFAKKIKYFDERLNKTVWMGNENIRGLRKWEQLFDQHFLKIEETSIEYIRLFPPFMINEKNYGCMVLREREKWKKSLLLREWFYVGINFTAKKLASCAKQDPRN